MALRPRGRFLASCLLDTGSFLRHDQSVNIRVPVEAKRA